MTNFQRVIEAVAALGEDARGVDISLGISNEGVEYLRTVHSATIQTHVYNESPPYAIDSAKAWVGYVYVQAQCRARTATPEEIEALAGAPALTIHATTIRVTA